MHTAVLVDRSEEHSGHDGMSSSVIDWDLTPQSLVSKISLSKPVVKANVQWEK